MNDLSNMVPSPYSEVEPVRPPSPEIVKGIPAGAESDTDSLGVEDSGMSGTRQRSESGHALPHSN